MYNFGKKDRNKIFLWILVGVLVLCMVLPTAYYLLEAIFG